MGRRVSEHNSLFTSSLGLQRGCGRYEAFQRRRSQSHSPADGESREGGGGGGGGGRRRERGCVLGSPSFDGVKRRTERQKKESRQKFCATSKAVRSRFTPGSFYSSSLSSNMSVLIAPAPALPSVGSPLLWAPFSRWHRCL